MPLLSLSIYPDSLVSPWAVALALTYLALAFARSSFSCCCSLFFRFFSCFACCFPLLLILFSILFLLRRLLLPFSLLHLLLPQLLFWCCSWFISITSAVVYFSFSCHSFFSYPPSLTTFNYHFLHLLLILPLSPFYSAFSTPVIRLSPCYAFYACCSFSFCYACYSVVPPAPSATPPPLYFPPSHLAAS